MPYQVVPSLQFILAGTDPGLVDFRKKASANGGVAGPVVTRSVPAGSATVIQATLQTYTTTSADYQTKFGIAYQGLYQGETASSNQGSGATQEIANAQALADATAKAIAQMTKQVLTTVPGAPTSVVATASQSSATPCVVVTATAPTNTGNATITSYKIYRNGSSTALATIQNPGTGNLSYTDATVSFGTAYLYRFSAVNSVGEGDLSLPSANATPTAPVAPSFNTDFNPGDNISTGTWNAAPGAILKLNLPLSTNTTPNPAVMLVFTDSSLNTQIGQFDYNGADTGVDCAIVYNGVTYLKKLTNDTITLS